jgi:hypothetical protein
MHAASGLLLIQRRAYSPDNERWLSEDPIGLKSGPNLYAYVLNDPTRWVDPDGTIHHHPDPWHRDPWWPQPNGNAWGQFTPQDGICSQPMGLLRFNSQPCILKCCQAHDDCYTASKCNWSSFLTIASDSACTSCNRTVVMCILNAPIGPDACQDCKK